MYLIIPTTRLLFEVTQWSMYTNNQYTVLAITIVILDGFIAVRFISRYSKHREIRTE